MNQLAMSCVLSLVAACLYLYSGARIVQVLRTPRAQVPGGLRWVVMTGLVVHCVAVAAEMFTASTIHFGVGLAISIMLLIAVVIFAVESLVHRITGLMGVTLIVAAVAAVLPVLFPGQAYDSAQWTVLFRIHLLCALAAYSFMTIAVIQAVLLKRMERTLRDPVANKESGFLSNMPSLLTMERILFRIVACGFVCLTLLLILGTVGVHETRGVWFLFDHKTILTVLSWIVFGVLLFGRYALGWRQKKAMAWFWTGTVFLALAYIIYSILISLKFW